MTLLEAFKAGCEFGYTNDDLYNKILIDRGLTSGTTYAKGNRASIDHCLIDLYTYLKTHPEIQDGKTQIKFDTAALSDAIYSLSRRYNLDSGTALGLGLGANVSGEAVW